MGEKHSGNGKQRKASQNTKKYEMNGTCGSQQGKRKVWEIQIIKHKTNNQK